MAPRIRRRITNAKREEIEKQEKEISLAIVRPFEILSNLPVSFNPPPNGHYEDVLKQPLTIKDTGVLYRSLMKSRENYMQTAPMFKLYWLKLTAHAKKLQQMELENRSTKGKSTDPVFQRKPILGTEVSARDVMVKLCDAAIDLGPHTFDIRLFIAKDKRSDKDKEKLKEEIKREKEKEKERLKLEKEKEKAKEKESSKGKNELGQNSIQSQILMGPPTTTPNASASPKVPTTSPAPDTLSSTTNNTGPSESGKSIDPKQQSEVPPSTIQAQSPNPLGQPNEKSPDVKDRPSTFKTNAQTTADPLNAQASIVTVSPNPPTAYGKIAKTNSPQFPPKTSSPSSSTSNVINSSEKIPIASPIISTSNSSQITAPIASAQTPTPSSNDSQSMTQTPSTTTPASRSQVEPAALSSNPAQQYLQPSSSSQTSTEQEKSSPSVNPQPTTSSRPQINQRQSLPGQYTQSHSLADGSPGLSVSTSQTSTTQGTNGQVPPLKPFSAQVNSTQGQQTPTYTSQSTTTPIQGLVPGGYSLHSTATNSTQSLGPFGQQVPAPQGYPPRGPQIQGQNIQGTPGQGSLVQGPLIQGTPVQSLSLQGPPVQGPARQGPPIQGPPVQGPPVQGPSNAPPPRSDPNNMQSAENTIMIANLNAIARVDQSLNSLMKIVALGAASPQQIIRFQGYIQRAREMGPQPHHSQLLNMRRPAPPPQPKKPPKEKRTYNTKKLSVAKELKLTAFQEKYLNNATILFEFVDNPNVRYALPKDVICEVTKEPKPPVDEDDEQETDILLSFIWIHNLIEVEKYEEQLAKYEAAVKEREEAEEAKRKKEEEDAKKEKEEEEEARRKAQEDLEKNKEGESVENNEVKKEEVEEVEKLTPNLRASRTKRKAAPPPKKPKPLKKLVPPTEPDIKFTCMSFSIRNVPGRFVPILLNSAKPLESVQKNMSNIIAKGTPMSNYYLWYQVDGKQDEALAESLRVELNQEEKKMNGVVYTSSSAADEANIKKRKQKEEKEEKQRLKKMKKMEQLKQKSALKLEPGSSDGTPVATDKNDTTTSEQSLANGKAPSTEPSPASAEVTRETNGTSESGKPEETSSLVMTSNPQTDLLSQLSTPQPFITPSPQIDTPKKEEVQSESVQDLHPETQSPKIDQQPKDVEPKDIEPKDIEPKLEQGDSTI